MVLTFLWGPSEQSQSDVVRQWKSRLGAEASKKKVLTHLRYMHRGLGKEASKILAAGFRLPGGLMSRIIAWRPKFNKGTWSKMPVLKMCQGFCDSSSRVKSMSKEAMRLRFLVQSFMSGTMDAYVLILFSRWSGKKKWVRTMMTVPPTLMHVSWMREKFRQEIDPEIEFSVQLAPEIQGLIGRVRWAIDSAHQCVTDSAYFIEVQLPNIHMEPQVRFNTGRILKNIQTPWVGQLLQFAYLTVEQGFFEPDEPIVIMSLILSAELRLVTGVRLRAGEASSSTEPADPAPADPDPPGSDAPDGAGADTPGSGPDSPPPTGASPAEPHPPAAS